MMQTLASGSSETAQAALMVGSFVMDAVFGLLLSYAVAEGFQARRLADGITVAAVSLFGISRLLLDASVSFTVSLSAAEVIQGGLEPVLLGGPSVVVARYCADKLPRNLLTRTFSRVQGRSSAAVPTDAGRPPT